MEQPIGKYTQQQNVFLDTFTDECFKGTDANEAAKIAKTAAGYSDGYPIDSILTVVQEELVKRCAGRLALQLPSAVVNLAKVMADPEQGGSRRILEALTIIMDRSGLVKKEHMEVEVKAENGIVLIPPKTK